MSCLVSSCLVLSRLVLYCLFFSCLDWSRLVLSRLAFFLTFALACTDRRLCPSVTFWPKSRTGSYSNRNSDRNSNDFPRMLPSNVDAFLDITTHHHTSNPPPAPTHAHTHAHAHAPAPTPTPTPAHAHAHAPDHFFRTWKSRRASHFRCSLDNRTCIIFQQLPLFASRHLASQPETFHEHHSALSPCPPPPRIRSHADRDTTYLYS